MVLRNIIVIGKSAYVLPLNVSIMFNVHTYNRGTYFRRKIYTGCSNNCEFLDFPLDFRAFILILLRLVQQLLLRIK